LNSLQPQHPAFAAFRTALAKLRAGNVEAMPPIASGSRIKPGESDARIPKIRTWLGRIGYLSSLEPMPSSDMTASIDAPEAGSENELFDEQLAAAVKAFQTDSGIKSTGYLDKQTIAALNKRDPKSDETRLVANMERLRWLPRDLGSRYVFVNQAAFRLQVIDNGQEVWTTKVVVGKPDTQTAAFHDQMETIVFNPSWGVPQSIITKEMLPELRKDASYLDRQGFRVKDKTGKVVKSSEINWFAYGDKPPFDIEQPPSGDNALGDIKFLFPNAHSIYMHDTPMKQLFAKSMRAFSHGCVRVENPREFASVLLGRSREEIDAEIDGGISHSVPVTGDIKVHITYFTAWPDKDGRIVHYNDVYNRDGGIITQFGGIAVAAK